MRSASLSFILLGVALICAVCSILLFMETDGGISAVPRWVRKFETKEARESITNNEEDFSPADDAPDNATQRDDELPGLLALSDPTRDVKLYRSFLDVADLASLFFGGNMCQAMWGSDTTQFEYRSQHSTIVDITFNCNQQFEGMPYGTGNLMMTFYAVRATARASGMTDVILQCDDAEERKSSLILPWLMGIFPRLPSEELEENGQQPTVDEICNYKLPGPMRVAIVLGWILPEISFDLRRMAIAMVGIPSPDHPSASWAEANLWQMPPVTHKYGRNYMQLPHPKKGAMPLYPDTPIDDAVIHFRCGDLANNNKFKMMGFMKFGSYARHLSSEVRSIGIVTQPFDNDAQQVRPQDADWIANDRCRVLVGAFDEYLREQFPGVRVSVYNSRSETIALTFARMIMANQTIVGITSFGIFPALTTFGTGYIRHVEGDIHDWLVTPPMLQQLENVTLIPEPMLIPLEFKRLWGENGTDALVWFREAPPPLPSPPSNSSVSPQSNSSVV